MRAAIFMTGPRRAFTLVELMVTVLIGVVVLMGVYAMHSVSVDAYRVQDQASTTVAQLRLGLHQLRAELRSVGFNAPASGSPAFEPWVTVINGFSDLAGIVIERDAPLPVANPTHNTHIEPVRIRLLGDFESQRLYRTREIQGSRVYLDTVLVPSGALTEAEFARVFVGGLNYLGTGANVNLLRLEIQTARRREVVGQIVGANWNAGIPYVDLNGAVPNPDGALGLGTGHEVTVLTYVRYRVRKSTGRDLASLKYDLVRERINPLTGAGIAGSLVIVAEYVVDFQVYDLCVNTTPMNPNTGDALPVALACYQTLEAFELVRDIGPGATNQTSLLRSLALKLSARSAYEDPTISFAPRPTRDEPLRAFELDPNLDGAARVYEAASVVALTSVQSRRL
jgi:prepilin-type N-terminal cleavage/methylation domain-containing protein